MVEGKQKGIKNHGFDGKTELLSTTTAAPRKRHGSTSFVIRRFL